MAATRSAFSPATVGSRTEMRRVTRPRAGVVYQERHPGPDTPPTAATAESPIFVKKIGDDAVAASRPTPRNRAYGVRAAITATVVLHKVHKAGAQLTSMSNLFVAGLYLNTRAGILPCGVSRV